MWHIPCSKPGVRLYAYIVAVFFAVQLRVQAESSAIDPFPFEFHDGFLWVKVQVSQSAEPLNFLLDSGAGVSVINLNTAHRLNVRLGQAVIVQGVQTTSTGYWAERLNATAGSVPLPKNYLAVDLGKLSHVCNCCVDGLIGMDFFRNRVVQIDYANHLVRLVKDAGKAEGQTTVVLKTRRCGIEVPIQVNGSEPKLARLDTGCASALQWVAKDVSPKECTQRTAVALSRFTINETQSIVWFGSNEFQSVTTGIHTEEMFAGEAGLIGNGLLSHFTSVTIDAKHGQLILGERVSD